MTDPSGSSEPQEQDQTESQKSFERRKRAEELVSSAYDARIPPRHIKFSYDQNKSERWKKANDLITRRVRENRSVGVVFALIGPRGTGKTQAAVCCMMSMLARKTMSCLYATATDFFIDLKECYRKDGPRERDVLRRYEAPGLLTIDELQERSESSWENQMLSYLIDKRYRECRSTIMIANLKHDAFRESVGASVFDRLRELGGVLEFDWDSFR